MFSAWRQQARPKLMALWSAWLVLSTSFTPIMVAHAGAVPNYNMLFDSSPLSSSTTGGLSMSDFVSAVLRELGTIPPNMLETLESTAQKFAFNLHEATSNDGQFRTASNDSTAPPSPPPIAMKAAAAFQQWLDRTLAMGAQLSSMQQSLGLAAKDYQILRGAIDGMANLQFSDSDVKFVANFLGNYKASPSSTDGRIKLTEVVRDFKLALKQQSQTQPQPPPPPTDAAQQQKQQQQQRVKRQSAGLEISGTISMPDISSITGGSSIPDKIINAAETISEEIGMGISEVTGTIDATVLDVEEAVLQAAKPVTDVAAQVVGEVVAVAQPIINIAEEALDYLPGPQAITDFINSWTQPVKNAIETFMGPVRGYVQQATTWMSGYIVGGLNFVNRMVISVVPGGQSTLDKLSGYMDIFISYLHLINDLPAPYKAMAALVFPPLSPILYGADAVECFWSHKYGITLGDLQESARLLLCFINIIEMLPLGGKQQTIVEFFMQLAASAMSVLAGGTFYIKV